MSIQSVTGTEPDRRPCLSSEHLGRMSELCLLCPAWGSLAQNQASDPASRRAAGLCAAGNVLMHQAAILDAEAHLSADSMELNEERRVWLGLGALASKATS